jgi:hypothetical protein
MWTRYWQSLTGQSRSCPVTMVPARLRSVNDGASAFDLFPALTIAARCPWADPTLGWLALAAGRLSCYEVSNIEDRSTVAGPGVSGLGVSGPGAWIKKSLLRSDRRGTL